MTVTAGAIYGLGNAKRSICLLANATATNNPPTLSTDGVPCYPPTADQASDKGACYATKPSLEAMIVATNRAGSGTVATTLRLWGYLHEIDLWVPVGVGAATTKGQLNAAVSIGETVSDGIRHAEPVYLSGLFDRLYVEVVAISGSGTAIDVMLVTPRTRAF